MQAMMDAMAVWIVLLVGLAIAAVGILAARNARARRRRSVSTQNNPLSDPDGLNALAAGQHVIHGQAVVDRADWHHGIGHGNGGGDVSSGDAGGGGSSSAD